MSVLKRLNKCKVNNHYMLKSGARDVLFIWVLIILSYSLFSQSRYQKMRKVVRGTNIEFGLNQTNFLTNRFNQLVNDEQVSQVLYDGFAAGIDVKAFPMAFGVKYFNNKFNLSESTSGFYFDSDVSEVKHIGVSLGTSIYLFHFTKYFLPYIGVGYQFGMLEGKEEEVEYRSHLYTGYGSFGLEVFPFNGLGFKAEYLRSVFHSGDDRKFNQYNISILFNLVKIFGKYEG